jgi:hypothetical protein
MYNLLKLFSICFLLGCGSEIRRVEPIIQTGDLLFQQWDSSDFAKAISLQVLEAVTGEGVILRPIQSFLNASLDAKGNPRVAIGRLKKDYSTAIPAINSWATAKVGMSYDSLFIYGNDKYYCSELIHDAFNQNVSGGNVFTLAPMTFKDPDTDNYFPVWIDYYRKYNETIPEGELGINPGLMSRSNKIEIIAKLWRD